MTQEKLIKKYLSGGTSGKASNMEIIGDVLYSYFRPLAKRIGSVYFIESREEARYPYANHWWQISWALKEERIISIYNLDRAKADGDFASEIKRRVRNLKRISELILRSRQMTTSHLKRFYSLTCELVYFINSVNELFNLSLTIPEVELPNPNPRYLERGISLEDIKKVLEESSYPSPELESVSKTWGSRYFATFRPYGTSGTENGEIKSILCRDDETFLFYMLTVTEEDQQTIRNFIIKDML